MSKFLRYKKTGHIVTLTMNEPDSMNALSGPDQYADFEKYCARINQDYDVRCVILTGAGKAFSAGGNVKAHANASHRPEQRCASSAAFLSQNGYY